MVPYQIASDIKLHSAINIKILDAKRLEFSDVHELSALAYRSETLYALSDNKGILYIFQCKIDNNTIQELTLRERYFLQNKKGQRFKRKKRDAEGMTLYKEGLLISFERKNRVLYCSRKGVKIKKIALNSTLQRNDNYQSPNKGLESVAYSADYGVVTIPELPLKNTQGKYHTLYAKKKTWKFQAQGAVTDIAFMDDTNLLVLLREYSYFTNRHITSLLRVNLEQCNEKRICKSSLLAKLDSKKGWNIDNFEGVTKVSKNRFLMVSDDNDSVFQKTLLVLFEIMN
ncbi:MAG: esterase-like activity of phytase family protein [Epsilonproteobacteria bacterium]|nr:esterase-like activity of phytase family protein [Campylobacterota bacterium]